MVKRAGGLSDEGFRNDGPRPGSKRSVRDRLGGYFDDRNHPNNKRCVLLPSFLLTHLIRYGIRCWGDPIASIFCCFRLYLVLSACTDYNVKFLNRDIKNVGSIIGFVV